MIRFNASESYLPKVINLTTAFYACTALREILPGIDCGKITSYIDTFDFCSSLVTVKLFKLKADISFAESPLLSKDSILYMIQNSAATSAITITLHPTAYAMAMADSEIQAALESKTYVSLASA